MYLSMVLVFSTIILPLARCDPSTSRSNAAIDRSAITYLDNFHQQKTDASDSCAEVVPQAHPPAYAERAEFVWQETNMPGDMFWDLDASYDEGTVETVVFHETVWFSVEDFTAQMASEAVARPEIGAN